LLSVKEIENWLALSTVPNIGPRRFVILVKHFGSPEAVLNASLKELSSLPEMGEIIAKNIKEKVDGAFVDRQIALIEKNQVKFITFLEKEYPENLKNIYDFPPFIFILGDLRKEDKMALGIIGCRTPSVYGKNMAEKLSFELASRGYTIVSGFARGIDSISHLGAIKANGRTLAVLGCGLDRIYPPENKKLWEEIKKNGALVSEFYMDTPPEASNFPKRNRIISGLSLGVIIVEAGGKSGALITAEHALEQNRELFAIPGNVLSKTSEGANNLIKQGAKLVTTIEDILTELPNFEAEKKKEEKEKTWVLLSGEEKKVFEVISFEPNHVDRIAKETFLSTGQTLTALLSLELKGLVKQLSGKMFVRI
jgi:DNA processing protein